MPKHISRHPSLVSIPILLTLADFYGIIEKQQGGRFSHPMPPVLLVDDFINQD